MKQTVNFYAFNERGDINKAEREIIDSPVKFLKKELSSRFTFGANNIMNTGIYRLHAIAYDLRPFLKRIVIKQYGSWHEIYALNKTNARKLMGGRIDEIIELN